jgi:hypothetical protein
VAPSDDVAQELEYSALATPGDDAGTDCADEDGREEGDVKTLPDADGDGERTTRRDDDEEEEEEEEEEGVGSEPGKGISAVVFRVSQRGIAKGSVREDVESDDEDEASRGTAPVESRS